MKVAIMGYGVVGSGVAEVIGRNADIIAKKTGILPELSHILDIRDFPGDPFASFLTKEFADILEDDETGIVVETMGGLEPAFTFVSACLERGKHVVTSNKELVAKKGDVLLALAEKHNVNFLFEASVGGGIPIIRPLIRCLAGNRVEEIAGILNGTTNFILTKMIMEDMDFADALALAQKKGYAEKDPTADVAGIDACRKICILASLAFGTHIYPDGVPTKGITDVTLDDVKAAAAAGYVIKLIASAKQLENGRLALRVSPTLVKKESMLAGVNGVFNACLVRGDAVGDVLLYGQGAGKLATASAVVGDVIDCAAHDSARIRFGWNKAEDGVLEAPEAVPTVLFARLKNADMAAVAAALPGACCLDGENGETLVITEEAPAGKLEAALAAFAPVTVLPVAAY